MNWIEGFSTPPSDTDVLVALRDFDSPTKAIDRARSLAVLLHRFYNNDSVRVVSHHAINLRDTLVERCLITLCGSNVPRGSGCSFTDFIDTIGVDDGSPVANALQRTARLEAEDDDYFAQHAPQDLRYDGPAVDDFAVCVGAAAFFLTTYKAPDRESNTHVPYPLTDRLRAIATRPLTDAEKALDALLAAEGPWHAQYLSAPWIARRVLTVLRSPWWHVMTPEAAQHAADLLVANPLRWHWLADEIPLSAKYVSHEIAEITHGAWERINAPARMVVHVGLGALHAMDSYDRLFEQIASLEPEWQPSFMRSIADIARCHGRENRPLEERAMDACATLAEDVAQSDKVRQAALLWWCNWCRWNATPERLARVKAFRADPLVARGDQSVVLRMKSELARAEGK